MSTLRALTTAAVSLALLSGIAAPAAATSYAPPSTSTTKSGGHISSSSSTTHIKNFASVPAPHLAAPAFADTAASPFQTEINWLYASKITAGYADGTYRPAAVMDRGTAIAYLYRLAGSPKFTAPKVSAFADVKPGQTFYKEIHWAKAQGITAGYKAKTGKPTFRATSPVTRDAMTAFLFAHSGAKASYVAPKTSAFADVKATSGSHRAISWASTTGLSKGYAGTSKPVYKPGAAVTRGEGASFLYQFAHRVAPAKTAKTTVAPVKG